MAWQDSTQRRGIANGEREIREKDHAVAGDNHRGSQLGYGLTFVWPTIAVGVTKGVDHVTPIRHNQLESAGLV